MELAAVFELQQLYPSKTFIRGDLTKFDAEQRAHWNKLRPPPPGIVKLFPDDGGASDVPVAATNGHLPEDVFPEVQRDGPDEQDISSHKMTVTFFRDKTAQSMRAEELTLGEISVRIAGQLASNKASLPLLELKTFGTRRTELPASRRQRDFVLRRCR